MNILSTMEGWRSFSCPGSTEFYSSMWVSRFYQRQPILGSKLIDLQPAFAAGGLTLCLNKTGQLGLAEFNVYGYPTGTDRQDIMC